MPRIIGDVHGKISQYLEIIKSTKYSIQVGDLGFNYDFFKKNGINPNNHVFFGGNHDNYDTINFCNNNLGNFGFKKLGDFEFFFVRGAWSIDNKLRNHFDVVFGKKKIRPKNIWKEEQLNIEQGTKAFNLYKEIKPDFLLCHECPLNIVKHVANPEVTKAFGYDNLVIKTHTNILLQEMINFHPPKYCIFGHYHTNFSKHIDCKTGVITDNESDTKFICVNILDYIDI